MEIYVVISRCKRIQDFTSLGISQECYKTKKQAIEFCESKLTKQEIEENKKAKNRNLKSWYEFDSQDYSYEIKVLKVI